MIRKTFRSATPVCAGGIGARALLPVLALALALGIGLLVPLSTAARAHSYKLGAIAVGHMWAPSPGPDAEGIPVFGPMLNRGKTVARLVGASAPIAKRVRIRIDKDGKTRWPGAFELPPGKPRALAAWREHLWLTGLKRRPRPGEFFDLTLDFGAAGKLTVKVVVEKSPSH